MTDKNYSKLKMLMEEEVPFNKHLQMKLESIREGYCLVRIPWATHLTGDASRPAVHGGVLATLLDAAGGAACWSLLENESDRLSTVDLRIDYLRPGPAQAMICEAKVVRMGNKVCVARMEIFSEGDDPNEIGPIATGQGVYNVAKPKTRSNKV
ncbi:MAG: hotdog fold thioesterase [Deltaproteobacteria bacterium]|jgi:uncharacterized protein (TIGR00369 family)|nr:hotdog fold thioesterase [Deltaproteobacteria bacterium]MBT6431951.1 hotdog fold thioesterase [Deltaproteobacteria bacterium]